MIIGIGVDIVSNSRISASLKDNRLNFLKKILNKKELQRENYKNISIPHLAGIFAAKEAVIKSLSGVLGFSLNFQEIILTKDEDIPKVLITNITAQSKLSKVKVVISISHEKYYSIAFSVAEII